MHDFPERELERWIETSVGCMLDPRNIFWWEVVLNILRGYKAISKSICCESVENPRFKLFGYIPAWGQRQRSLK